MNRCLLGLVWLTVASSAVVFWEPAPVDLLTIVLVGLLPLVGLVRLKRSLVLVFAALLLIGAASFAASIEAPEQSRAALHIAIAVYLYFSFLLFAGFVVRAPVQHTRLLLSGSVAAGLIAATAGIVGYFDLVPGSASIFTLFERASGTFKDPNVFGPFLILPLLYCLSRGLTDGPMRAAINLAVAGVLAFGLLLTFSRGAWLAAAIGFLVFYYLSFVTAPTNRVRVRMIGLALAGLATAFVALGLALDNDHLRQLMEQRLTLTQSYDVGPEGRFGGQRKAIGFILAWPLGLGSLEFAPTYHSEEPHNVYLTMMLNAGWIGGLLFLIVSLTTVFMGLRHAFRRTATQPLFIVALAAFVGHVVEGLIIDSDHWRHFYFLLALVWGMMAGDRQLMAIGAMTGPKPVLLGGLADIAIGRPAGRPATIVATPIAPALEPLPDFTPVASTQPDPAASQTAADRRNRRRRRRLSKRQKRIIRRISEAHVVSDTVIHLTGPVDPDYLAVSDPSRAPRSSPAVGEATSNVISLPIPVGAYPGRSRTTHPTEISDTATPAGAEIIQLRADKGLLDRVAPKPRVPDGVAVWTFRDRADYVPVERRRRQLRDAVASITRRRGQPPKMVDRGPQDPTEPNRPTE